MKYAYALICNDSAFMSHECHDVVFVCKNKKQLDSLIKRANFITNSFTSKDKSFSLIEIEIYSSSQKVLYLKQDDSDLNYCYSNVEHLMVDTPDNLDKIKAILAKMKQEELSITHCKTIDIKNSLTQEDIKHFLKEYVSNNYLGLEYIEKVKKTGEFYQDPDYHYMLSFAKD